MIMWKRENMGVGIDDAYESSENKIFIKVVDEVEYGGKK